MPRYFDSESRTAHFWPCHELADAHHPRQLSLVRVRQQPRPVLDARFGPDSDRACAPEALIRSARALSTKMLQSATSRTFKLLQKYTRPVLTQQLRHELQVADDTEVLGQVQLEELLRCGEEEAAAPAFALAVVDGLAGGASRLEDCVHRTAMERRSERGR